MHSIWLENVTFELSRCPEAMTRLEHQHQQQPQVELLPTQGAQQEVAQSSVLSLQNVLLSCGALSVIGMFHFYRKRQTVPFKACYALMWPTLGVGTILAVSPSPGEMSRRLEHSRGVSKDDLRKHKEANAATIESMMKQYAHKHT